MITSAVGNSET